MSEQPSMAEWRENYESHIAYLTSELEAVKAGRDAALVAVRLAIEHGSFPQGSGILHQLRDAAREG